MHWQIENSLKKEWKLPGRITQVAWKRIVVLYLVCFQDFCLLASTTRPFLNLEVCGKSGRQLIRKKAGLGVIDQQLKPDYYDKQYKFYDVVVVGGGPAGMQAAIDAGIGNCEVLLVDENPILGGSLNYTRLDAKGVLSQQIREELVTEIQANSNITVMTNAVCKRVVCR